MNFEEYQSLFVILIGAIVVSVLCIWKTRKFSYEDRKKSQEFLKEKNLKGKIFWISMVFLGLSNIISNAVKDYSENFPIGLFLIPLWILTVFLMVRNHKILLNGNFPKKLVDAELYIGLVIISFFGALLMTL